MKYVQWLVSFTVNCSRDMASHGDIKYKTFIYFNQFPFSIQAVETNLASKDSHWVYANEVRLLYIGTLFISVIFNIIGFINLLKRMYLVLQILHIIVCLDMHLKVIE